MERRFGDRDTFAVEVGEVIPPSLRVVDLWAAGKRWTTDDNVVFVPSFCNYTRRVAARVRERNVLPCPFPELSPEEIFQRVEADDADETGLGDQRWLLDWSEIVDNVSRYAYLDTDLVIMFGFWRARHPFPEDMGSVFVARIPPEEFVTTLLSAVDFLDARPVD